MSPRLWSHTWTMHVAPGALVGLAALAAWCVGLVGLQLVEARAGASLLLADPDALAALVLGGVAAAVGGAQVLVEGRIERTSLPLRALEAAVAALLSGATASIGVLLLDRGDGLADDTLAWRARAGAWLLVGLAGTLGPLLTRLVRRGLEAAQVRWDLRALPPPPVPEAGVGVTVLLHLTTGLASGALASVVAYVVGLEAALDDRHLGFALGCWTIGFVDGLVALPVPARFWRGWIRVVRGARPGWRVAVDPTSPVLSERFVGSFPSGVDLHLPAEDGLAELHASFLARADGTFAVRGLTVRPVRVRRFLERVDLTWDPGLPAPLETPLVDGDRVELGAGVEVELVVLPREGATG